MWAGGDLKFSLGRDGRGVRFYDQAIMKERVESVKPRGEKLFVWFERRIWSAQQNGEKLGQPLPEDGQDVKDGEEKVIERRCLVFMPSVSPDAPKATPLKAQESQYIPRAIRN